MGPARHGDMRLNQEGRTVFEVRWISERVEDDSPAKHLRPIPVVLVSLVGSSRERAMGKEWFGGHECREDSTRHFARLNEETRSGLEEKRKLMTLINGIRIRSDLIINLHR